MTIEVVLPLNSYPTGETPLETVDIPDEMTECRFSILRCTALTPDIWPDAETAARVECEVLVDGNWVTFWDAPDLWYGDVAKNKFGQDIVDSSFSGPLPAGTGRQMRGTLIVQNGPLRSQASFEFFIPQ